MAKRNEEGSELEEQLADSQTQIEALQAAAADAEARAATARSQLAETKERAALVETELQEAGAARDSAQGELTQLRSELTEARSQLREAAVKYRQARLAGAPEIPQDLVPAGESLEEIDRQFEAAQRVVSQLREKMEEETREQNRSARVPAGSPPRRPADLSGLPPAEKIKIGLQQLSEREGR